MQDTGSSRKLSIVCKIGKGAFGEVFKGSMDGQICAVKTIPDETEGHGKAVQMFHREAAVLRACNHNRIIGFKALVRISDHQSSSRCRKGGRWAMVLEYAKGGPLSAKVSQAMIHPLSRVYSTAQALGWALDIATALQYLHTRRPAVLHRDVKLSNVLLTKEDNKWVAKLSDLGLHVAVGGSRNCWTRSSLPQWRNSASTAYHIRRASAPSVTTAVAAPSPSKVVDAAAAAGRDTSVRSELCSTCGATALCGCSNNSNRTGCEAPRGVNNIADSNSASATLTKIHLQVLQQQLQETTAAVTEAGGSAKAGSRPAGDKDSAWGQQGILRMQSLGSTQTVCIKSGQANHNAMPGCAGASVVSGKQQYVSPARTASSATSATSTVVEPAGLMRSKSMGPVAAAAARHSRDGGAASVHAVGFERRSSSAATGADQLDTFPSTSSMRSMATDGTWLTDTTALRDASASTAAAAVTAVDKSLRGDGHCSSCVTDIEMVYDMTGQTGSLMYMAPEVFLGRPYNERADVFSFGVLLYELVAKCLLLFTELPNATADPAITVWYAKRVCRGYRPSRPKRMSAGVWSLIQACWQQDSSNRPDMIQVVTELKVLLTSESGQAVHAPEATDNKPVLGTASEMSHNALPCGDDSGADTTEEKLPCAASAVSAAGDGTKVRDRYNLPGPAPTCGCIIC